MQVKTAVMERYSQGAKAREEALCCPVSYDEALLAALPAEIIDRDYGCGDPSAYVRTGDVVLDLGSGAGKICYIAAQLVGERGRVIGVDMNREMLDLARKYQAQIAERLGGDRVSFKRAHIEDLAIDLDKVEEWLAEHPVRDADSLSEFEHWRERLREHEPMIADASVDLVISNCVLNLVDDRNKARLLSEVFRVLKPGGRVAIADIVSDEIVPARLKRDPGLWSGCIAGAFQEHDFIAAFKQAGFVAVHIDQWAEQPWQVIEGIEFRPVTLTARKGLGSECIDKGHAVIYRGPFVSVTDDEDHVFIRGERMAVCERSFQMLTQGAYAADFIGIAPAVQPEPVPWCAPPGTKRTPAQTKGASHRQGDGKSGKCC